MSDSLSTQLAAIQIAGTAKLHSLWQQNFPHEPPPKLRKNLLAATLAYRLQEQAFGSMSSSVRARLRGLARRVDANPETLVSRSVTIKPGTRLIRHWQGKNHLVTVEQDRFAYCGSHYQSLSQIARLITGTRWSGPAFFGLRSRGKGETSHGR